MRHMFVSFAIAACALSAAPAKAAPLELDPSSDWTLREYDDKCRMTRKFGDGEDSVTLWIDKGGSGRYVNITLIGRPFRSPYGSRTQISFRPGDTINRGFTRNTSSKGRPVLSMFGVAPISFAKTPKSIAVDDGEEETVDLSVPAGSMLASPEELQKRYDEIEALELSGSLVQKVSLKTGGLASMISQLEECTKKLLLHRSQTSSGEARAGRGARTKGEREWAQKIQMAYPGYLLREMGQGTVGVRVQVSPEGRATFCEVMHYTGPAGLNDSACLGMIRHARFEPALDEDGNPTWGRYATRITYRIN